MGVSGYYTYAFCHYISNLKYLGKVNHLALYLHKSQLPFYILVSRPINTVKSNPFFYRFLFRKIKKNANPCSWLCALGALVYYLTFFSDLSRMFCLSYKQESWAREMTQKLGA